jgi:hypothetical protein
MTFHRDYFAECLGQRAFMDLDEDTLELAVVGTDRSGPHNCIITVKQRGVDTKEVRAVKDDLKPRAEKWGAIDENIRSLGFKAVREFDDGRNKISYFGVIEARWEFS